MILKFIKSLFQKNKASQTQEKTIYKSLNASPLIDIINQDNLRNKPKSNNNN
jgi:hypothetical protein